MKRVTRNFLSFLSVFALGVLVTIGASVFAVKDTQEDLPFEELKRFTEVFGKIKSEYVDIVDDETLLQNALQGMLSGLDPHSSYLEPKGYEDMKIGTSGEFGGLGIEVTMENGFVKVISPIDDTPAQRAGIEAGDLIIRLDDTPVKGMELKDAVDIMRGKPGDPIELTVLRDGKDQPFKVEIIRDIIKITSVRSKTLEAGFGYVRITSFQQRTGEQLEKAIKALEEENEGELKGLVLDLRNNPGGLLNAAVDVAGTFLDGGLVVYTEGRVDAANREFKAKRRELLKDVPIVTLINGGSASASEIVAGALQDRERSVIVGTQSFGKGSVQSILPMRGGAALKITTARYFTPAGRSIQAEGIVPDIEFDTSIKITTVKNDDIIDGVKEKDLTGHLENPNGEEESDSKKDTPKEDQEAMTKDSDNTKDAEDKSENDAEEKKVLKLKASDDFQLYEALNLLKGFHIINKVHAK